MLSVFRNKIKGVSQKLYWKEIISLCILLVAVIFFRSEKKELAEIVPQLQEAKTAWLFAGLLFTCLYIIFQAGIYRRCFDSIGIALKWQDAILLFLKRSLLSIFLPAHKSEVIFSQGMFDVKVLQQQDIIAIHDADNHIKAFLNIIPDFTPDECTYDLIRKTADAPGGCIDALIIRLVEYGKNKGLHFINMGMVPMQGQRTPENAAEQLMKLAVKKIRLFRHYQDLRDFKAKYATIWENKYLVYENDFDLLLLPNALLKVMQP